MTRTDAKIGVEWFCLLSVFASISPSFLSSREIYYIFIIMIPSLYISPLHWEHSSCTQPYCYLLFIHQTLEIISPRRLHWSSKSKVSTSPTSCISSCYPSVKFSTVYCNSLLSYQYSPLNCKMLEGKVFTLLFFSYRDFYSAWHLRVT